MTTAQRIFTQRARETATETVISKFIREGDRILILGVQNLPYAECCARKGAECVLVEQDHDTMRGNRVRIKSIPKLVCVPEDPADLSCFETDTFDAAIALGYPSGFAEPLSLIHEALRVVKPGRVCAFSFPNKSYAFLYEVIEQGEPFLRSGKFNPDDFTVEQSDSLPDCFALFARAGANVASRHSIDFASSIFARELAYFNENQTEMLIAYNAKLCGESSLSHLGRETLVIIEK